jgi:hypothetical protein
MPSQRLRTKPLDPRLLALGYLGAKEQVIEAGFADEIDWQDSLVFDDLDEPTFLRESAWVVLSCGFRESVLRRHFGKISEAFLNWVSADRIILWADRCRNKALSAFGNERKIDGILKIVHRVAAEGIDIIRDNIRERGTDFIRELPFMGPVTALHLAKNLGLQVVKPDRHLVRLAHVTGYESADCMCRKIAEYVGDSLSVIDVVLWRYATISNSYEAVFYPMKAA